MKLQPKDWRKLESILSNLDFQLVFSTDDLDHVWHSDIPNENIHLTIREDGHATFTVNTIVRPKYTLGGKSALFKNLESTIKAVREEVEMLGNMI